LVSIIAEQIEPCLYVRAFGH